VTEDGRRPTARRERHSVECDLRGTDEFRQHGRDSVNEVLRGDDVRNAGQDRRSLRSRARRPPHRQSAGCPGAVPCARFSSRACLCSPFACSLADEMAQPGASLPVAHSDRVHELHKPALQTADVSSGLLGPRFHDVVRRSRWTLRQRHTSSRSLRSRVAQLQRQPIAMIQLCLSGREGTSRGPSPALRHPSSGIVARLSVRRDRGA
jgi:hypothetical protein